jgi:hypothetical protein
LHHPETRKVIAVGTLSGSYALKFIGTNNLNNLMDEKEIPLPLIEVVQITSEAGLPPKKRPVMVTTRNSESISAVSRALRSFDGLMFTGPVKLDIKAEFHTQEQLNDFLRTLQIVVRSMPDNERFLKRLES